MPSIKVRRTVAANTRIENVLAGSPFEFLSGSAKVAVAATQATGLGDVEADITFGPEVQVQRAPLNVETAAGTGPKVPDDIIIEEFGAAGDRLQVSLAEVAGTNTDAIVLLSITPIG